MSNRVDPDGECQVIPLPSITETTDPISARTPKRITKVERSPLKPWSIAELDRLLGVTLHLPDDLLHPTSATDGIRARYWWSALLLILLDTKVNVSAALRVEIDGFDRHSGRLWCDRRIHDLHSFTVGSIDRLLASGPQPRQLLLPWKLDQQSTTARHRVWHMLWRAYRNLLFRCDLPARDGNLFGRLQASGAQHAGLLDRLAPDFSFRAIEGKPSFRRYRPSTQPLTSEWLAPAGSKSTRNPAGSKCRRNAETERYEAILARSSPRSILWFYETIYLPHRLAGRSPRTDIAYRRGIRDFLLTLDHPVAINELSDELLMEFRVARIAAAQRDARKLSNSTVNMTVRHLVALANFARKRRDSSGQRYADYVPDLQPLKALKRTAVAWDFKTEVPRLLASADAETGSIGGVPACAFWRALITTLLYTGARISAVMNLPLTSVDFERGTIRLPAEMQKQGADQEHLLHPRALEALRAITTQWRTFLFPWTADRTQSQWGALNRRFRRIIRRAALSDSGPRLFHKLRVTCATYLYAKSGGNIDAVRRQLGHSSVQVTWGYIDMTKSGQPTAALLLDDLPGPADSEAQFGDDRQRRAEASHDWAATIQPRAAVRLA